MRKLVVVAALLATLAACSSERHVVLNGDDDAAEACDRFWALLAWDKDPAKDLLPVEEANEQLRILITAPAEPAQRAASKDIKYRSLAINFSALADLPHTDQDRLTNLIHTLELDCAKLKA